MPGFVPNWLDTREALPAREQARESPSQAEIRPGQRLSLPGRDRDSLSGRAGDCRYPAGRETRAVLPRRRLTSHTCPATPAASAAAHRSRRFTMTSRYPAVAPES